MIDQNLEAQENQIVIKEEHKNHFYAWIAHETHLVDNLISNCYTLIRGHSAYRKYLKNTSTANFTAKNNNQSAISQFNRN